ncbi:hypothetical protein [Anatilimnocola floriformis]|uniref:hypothetical protein n=1 Tax=Anatilimnocola floriformis TaxID=2948575 RepID=UPI0020C224E8|nr:hypothetical protein [Anatilimnocola floriformis]
MHEPRSYPAAVVAVLLLLTPLIYVGSYCLLVDTNTVCLYGNPDLRYRTSPELCAKIFWPVEQVDRRVRPDAWEDPLIKLIISSIEPESWDRCRGFSSEPNEH